MNIDEEIAWAEREASYGGPSNPVAMARVYLNKYRTLLSAHKTLQAEINKPPEYEGKHRNEPMQTNTLQAQVVSPAELKECPVWDTDCGYDTFQCPYTLDAEGRCPKHGKVRP